MSTPQDDPDAQGGRPGGPPDGRPMPYGQPGPSGPSDSYGRQESGGQYGYQGAQPYGYAYPTSGDDAGTSDRGPAPKEVERAYHLILAAGAVYLVSAILSTLTTQFPATAGAAAVAVTVSIVFAVAFTALYVVLAIFIRKGRNWARITATVLAALNVLSVLASLLLLPVVTRAAEAGGQAVPEGSGLSTALSAVVMLLGVAGVAMTYLKPARPYFAPRKTGY